ncbi:hypothetical protein [Clostridium sp.]|uniref:hypothetical protein n=1 Tax=Clostridium sp. TaxID=1506 RepID=UPI002FC76BD3
MKLDLLNASPEILPIYEYFLSIGIPPTTAAKILTDPIIPKLVSLSKGNLFKNAISSGGVSSILNTSLSSLATKLFENGGTQAEINKIIDKLKIYRKLFKGARELTSIGTTLGINGGIDVVLGAPLLYQLNVEYNIKKLSGVPKNFSAEIFFNNLAYAES